MRAKEAMYDYQKYAASRIIEIPNSGLFMGMGMGKTVSCLTAIDELLFNYCETDKPLIIAPKRVVEDVWPEEIGEWDHLKHLKISVVKGDARQRINALNEPADVYGISRNNFSWLVNHYKTKWPFDMLVIDESSGFKNPGAKRTKHLFKILKFVKRAVILTGTPRPNGYLDLWSQIYILDKGERLGKSMTVYKDKFFKPGRGNGQIVFDWVLQQGADESINKLVSDICVSMKTSDYVKLPDTLYHFVNVNLSDSEKKKYRQFEKEQVLRLGIEAEEEEISASNAAALSGKLLQFANGAVYDDEKKYHVVHTAKLEMLEELVEAADGNVLVAYSFESDIHLIREKLAAYNPRLLKKQVDIDDWKAGNIKVLMLHPESGGHGLNLQAGGHTIIWYGNTFSLEGYLQLNARLPRGDQKHVVHIYHLVTVGTRDEDAIKAVTSKDEGQSLFMDSIKAVIKRVKKEL